MNVPADDVLSLNELAAALAKAQGAMNNASMNRINPHFKSKYADLAALWDAVRKPLSDNGLSVVQIIRDGSLHTMLLHTSGQRLCSDYPLPATARPQEMGSALTYARRYSLSALVGIAADEDDDATAAAVQPAGTKQTPKYTESAVVEPAPHDAADAAPLVVGSVSGAAVSIEDMAWEAAMRGEDVFNDFYKRRSREEKALVNAIGPELREQMKLTEAYKRGQQSRSAGHKRQALPGEYREDDRAREGLCWTAGFDGDAMPEFGD
jgi:ERF superfamily